MINNVKKDEISRIVEYVKANSIIYNKLTVIGKCTTNEATIDDILELVVKLNPDYVKDNKSQMYDLMCIIDDITEGNFNLIVDSGHLTNSTLQEISEGVTIYEYLQKT